MTRAPRLFLAGVFQETIDFSPIPTCIDDFRDQLWRPRELDTPPEHVNLLGYGAALDAARERGFAIIPSLFALAEPGARPRRQDWELLKGEILDDLRQAGRIDMVFLFLHGAMSAQGLDDCDGDLVAGVRAIVGPYVPIAAEFDLHGNMSAQLVRNATVLIACKEYPHIDFAEQGRAALDLLERTWKGQIRPTMSVVRVPLLAIAPTTSGPMQAFVNRIRAAEHQTGVLSVSAFHGMFAADHPDVGGSVVVVTDNDAEAARSLAFQFGRELIQAVRAQGKLGLSLEVAVSVALSAPERAIIADRADNPGGGAAGDSTYILAELLRRGVTNAAVGYLWDPIAVEFCHRAGVGARFDLRLGGKVGVLSGAPLDLRVEVTALATDICQAWFGRGAANLPMGRSAAVRAAGIEIVLGSLRHQVFSRHVFEGHGIDLESKHIIVVKSIQHFYEAFAPLGRVIYCDAPGTVTMDFTTLPYRRLRRPILPLDDFAAEPHLIRQ